MMRQIVITDGHTLNPGDLSWAGFAPYGDLTFYERTAPSEVPERCREADLVIVNKTPFPAATVAALPRLRLILVTATGYNNIDMPACREQGITVCNVPAYGTASVAQHAAALMLELTNRVGRHVASVDQGDWSAHADWSYTLSAITELEGKILGIIGMGHIGRRMAAIGQALGMRVLYHVRRPGTDLPGEPVSLEVLFRESDVLSLHCPLTDETKEIIQESTLRLMKPEALLINTARGGLIREEDLRKALLEGRIAGAALDVLSSEPPPPDHPLLYLPNCIITPHMAWMSREARRRIMNITLENLKGWAEGKEQNKV